MHKQNRLGKNRFRSSSAIQRLGGVSARLIAPNLSGDGPMTSFVVTRPLGLIGFYQRYIMRNLPVPRLMV